MKKKTNAQEIQPSSTHLPSQAVFVIQVSEGFLQQSTQKKKKQENKQEIKCAHLPTALYQRHVSVSACEHCLFVFSIKIRIYDSLIKFCVFAFNLIAFKNGKWK